MLGKAGKAASGEQGWWLWSGLPAWETQLAARLSCLTLFTAFRLQQVSPLVNLKETSGFLNCGVFDIWEIA